MKSKCPCCHDLMEVTRHNLPKDGRGHHPIRMFYRCMYCEEEEWAEDWCSEIDSDCPLCGRSTGPTKAIFWTIEMLREHLPEPPPVIIEM